MKRHIILITLALIAASAFAQHDEQVTVEGKYRPKVNKVNKLTLTPETPRPTYEFPSSEVSPKETTQRFALDLEKIAPAAFSSKNDKLVNPTQNFLMAGFGTRISPVFLYKHNSMLTKTLGLGVGVKHNSSWLNIDNYAPSSYMNNLFDVNLSTSMFNGLQVDGGVYYKNDMYHYYGMNLMEVPVNLTEAQMEEACPRQTYNTIGAHLGLSSTSNRTGELSHVGSVDYHYTFDRLDAHEHFVDVAYALGYAQNLWGDKNHPQKFGVDLGFQYDGFMLKNGLSADNRILFKVNPFFEMSDDFFRLRLGFRMDGATMVNLDDKFLAIRPDLSGSLFVLGKKLEFYANLNGGRKLLTFSEIIEENPFYCNLPYFNWRVQNVKLGFEGGVRTNIAEIVDLHLGVRYRSTVNDPLYQQRIVTLFLPITPESQIPIWNSYELIYDETKTVNVLANARVKLRNGITTDLGFAYNSCRPSVEEYAWYRPTIEGKLKLTYDLNDNLAFNASFLYQGGRYAKIYNGEAGWKAVKIKDIFDLSLGADYKVNDQITAFALLDNVAHQKYHLYLNYPVTGIQFFAGVKLKF